MQLTISLAQIDIVLGDPDTNLKKAEQWAAEAARRGAGLGRHGLRFLEAHGGRRIDAGIDDGKAGGIQAAAQAVLVVTQLELAVARA